MAIRKASIVLSNNYLNAGFHSCLAGEMMAPQQLAEKIGPGNEKFHCVPGNDVIYTIYIKPMRSVFVFIFFNCLLTNSVTAQKIFAVKYASLADVKVFVVKYESQADLLVYKVTYASETGSNQGKWFFTEYASQANKKIFWVAYESQAHLKIYFVPYASRAGWKKPDKKHLLY